jgi:hypothetical protein
MGLNAAVVFATDTEAKALSSQALTVTPANLAAVFSAPPALGSVTPAAVSATKLTGATGTITTSQPVLDATQTWNSSGVTFTGLKANVTDTASAAASMLMDLQAGGVSQFMVRKDGYVAISQLFGSPQIEIFTTAAGAYARTGSLRNIIIVPTAGAGINLGSTNTLSWASGLPGFPAGDTILARDAANSLAQRNGTNAQVLQVYNTYTDASNYESGYIGWSGNVFYVTPTKAGTGVGRSMIFGGSFVTDIAVRIGGTNRWLFNSSNNLVCPTDNSYDIGASGATRPRHIYVGSDVVIGGALDHDGSTVGFYGTAPATRPAAYTQTYATATRTHSNAAQTAVATTGATITTPFGYTTAAQADDIVTQLNAARTDLLNLKQVVNQLLDDLQLNGLLQ